MIQTLLIARHGFRSNWVTQDWSTRNDSLSDLGRTQASDLASHLMSLPEDQRPTAIFSSPYYRCLQTSQCSSIALGIPIYVDHRISEWYSNFTASQGIQSSEPPSPHSLQTEFSEIEADAWSKLWYPPATGESIAQLMERMSKFLSQFIPEVEAAFPPERHERVLLVTHVAPIIALVRNLSDDTTLRVKPGCCSITEFECDPNAGSEVPKWLLKRLGDALYVTGDIKEWGFEDI
ncbi:histidine phosphatase superfamily [Rhodocollybia butyracea]|uniref:Histidine phosphatase superfamily n=1 Tax=Rhodocollybia butyracea TaxID=206335 RepID=A0A9P5PTH0_9AGAR|nr:histidine phosphatase superfamily [Rhodocollybia butyracea]